MQLHNTLIWNMHIVGKGLMEKMGNISDVLCMYISWCKYSGGNQNRGEIGFAYFLVILPSYEKSCIWLFISMPQKCCVWVSSVSAVCLQ